MIEDNTEAQRAEEVRKARVMTPTMLKALERLANGEAFTVECPVGIIDEIATTEARLGVRPRIGKDRISVPLAQRLLAAEFIAYRRMLRSGTTQYVFTKAGRAALKAAKKPKGEMLHAELRDECSRRARVEKTKGGCK